METTLLMVSCMLGKQMFEPGFYVRHGMEMYWMFRCGFKTKQYNKVIPFHFLKML